MEGWLAWGPWEQVWAWGWAWAWAWEELGLWEAWGAEEVDSLTEWLLREAACSDRLQLDLAWGHSLLSELEQELLPNRLQESSSSVEHLSSGA